MLQATSTMQSMDALYHHHEQENRRRYDERVREVEHASFSPLVFSLLGGMGKATQTVYKRLASLLSEKKKEPYSKIINFIRIHIRFSLLCSPIASLRNIRKYAASTYIPRLHPPAWPSLTFWYNS